MRRETEARGCWIKEMGVEPWKFMREQSVSEGVGFSGSRWIARQESERQWAIEEVAKSKEDGGRTRKGQGEKSGD